jgi:hypothetical protein
MGREHVEFIHPSDVAPIELPASGWPGGVEVRILSEDHETGAFTGMLTMTPGYRRPAGYLTIESEYYVWDGALRIGEEVRELGFYDWAPAGSVHEAWTAGDDGCELYFMARRGRPDFVPGATSPQVGTDHIQIDTERLPWQFTTIPGPPPGVFLKVLRTVPETGEGVFLEGLVPRMGYPHIEWHDCNQEVMNLQGEIWVANAGIAVPGDYVWRPAYVTHGPFYTVTGYVGLSWVETAVVNHYIDDPRRTVEDNRREAEQLGPPQDFLSQISASS